MAAENSAITGIHVILKQKKTYFKVKYFFIILLFYCIFDVLGILRNNKNIIKNIYIYL